MSIEKVLHDPIRPSKKEDGRKEWSFKAPSYDNRTSCSIRVGADYGTGFKTPVGSHKAKGLTEGPIPFGCEPFSPDKIFGKPNGSILKDSKP